VNHACRLLGAIVWLGITGLSWGEERNLIADPSFEQEKTLDAWTLQTVPGTSIRLDRAVARTGKASIAIDTQPGHEKDAYPAIKFSVPVKPGERYRAEVWIKSECTSELGGFIVLETTRGSQRFELMDGDQLGPRTKGWVKATAATVVATGAERLSLGLVAHGVGKAWFDDVRFVKVAEAPAQPPPGPIRLEVRADEVIQPRFDGFGGGYGDLHLWTGYARTQGVDRADVSLIARRLRAMRPHIVRLWYGYEYEPAEGKFAPESEPMMNLINTIRLYRQSGTDVVLNAMGDWFAYPAWMKKPGSASKLPAPGKREAMVRSYVDAVEFLRRKLGLDNVRYLALFVEPDNDYHRPIPAEEYVRLHKLLDELLVARGLRKEVVVLWSFDCAGPAHGLDPWCEKVLKAGLLRYVDIITAHTYKHRNVLSMDPWVHARLAAIRKASPQGTTKPFWITEFGYSNFLGDFTFDNPEMKTYEYGLFAADFAIQALRNRVSAALIWCLAPVYYSDQVRQKAALWEHKEGRWAPRPPFYSWSLLCRYTRPGSQVLATRTSPSAVDLRSVALRSSAGEITLLVVNRCLREIPLELWIPTTSGHVFHEYLYARGSIPTPDQNMLPPRAAYRPVPDAPLRRTIPQDAFLLLTEIDD
jgi:hypothetical protein